MQRILVALFFILFTGSYAEARNRHKMPFKGGNHDFFITGTIGSANHKVGDEVDSSRYEKEALSYGVEFDYRIAKYLSAGVGFIDFGEAEQFTETDTVLGETETLTLSTAGSGLKASVMLHTDIKDGPWFFFARWGKIDWDVDIIADLTLTGTTSFSDSSKLSSSDTDTFTGFGGAYHIDENVRVGLIFEQYEMEYAIVDPEDSTTDIYKHGFNNASITVTYSF